MKIGSINLDKEILPKVSLTLYYLWVIEMHDTKERNANYTPYLVFITNKNLYSYSKSIILIKSPIDRISGIVGDFF